MEKKSFLDRFMERIDANSLQAYILHLSRERGLFETVFHHRKPPRAGSRSRTWSGDQSVVDRNRLRDQ